MPMELAQRFRGLEIDNMKRVLEDEDAVEDFWSYYLTDAFPEHQDIFAKKIKKDWTNMDKSKFDMNYVRYLNKVKLNLNPATEKKKYLKSFIKIGNNLTNVIESTAVTKFKKNKGVIMKNIEVFNQKLNEMYESINKDSGHQKNSTKGIPKKILEKQREYEAHKNAD
jgi:CRISPR/Cas system-associated endonuclease/helicase Cas3